MSFAVVGVNHKNCPVEIRERVTFTHSKVIQGLQHLKKQGIKEVVILSTCNRSEIYIEDERVEEAQLKVIAFYKKCFNESGSKEDLSPYLFCYQHEEAIRHLFRVAVGLDSIVLGEDQFLGQVKTAYQDAVEQETSGKITHKIFREAITLAKRIKSEIKISEYPLSISHIAIQFLKEKQGSLEGKRALIIGLGQMSKLTLQYLLEERLDQIYVTNRSHKKAQEMKRVLKGIEVIPYEQRYEILHEVDFVISATASPHTILTYEEMPLIEKTLDIMDIAMPRDIDENIDKLPYVSVYHIDHLKEISKANTVIRETLSIKAEERIEEKILDLMKWLEQLKIEEVVQGLDRYCQDIKANTTKLLAKKIGRSIDEEVINEIMTETLKRCIRTPIVHLMKEEDTSKREAYAKVLSELFELDSVLDHRKFKNKN